VENSTDQIPDTTKSPVLKSRYRLAIKGNEALKALAAALAVLLAMGSTGYVGYTLGQKHPSGGLSSSVPSDISTKADFSYFWKSWQIVNDKFFGTVDDTKRLNGAISGMVAGLGDPYTVYLAPSDNAIFQSSLKGEFDGIGAELTMKDNYVTVVSPLPGSPAEKAGIKAQDIITKVDDKKTADYTFNDVVNLIRGPKGTTVTLTIVRANVDKPLTITVTRDTIVIKSVSSDSVGANKEYAYIKINEFGADTVDGVRTAMQTAVTQNKKGMIIDLRSNPGGYLDAAVQIIGMVIPNSVTSDKQPLKDRVAVITKDKQGGSTETRATNAAIADKLPLVVLVNGGSASASEIFSGAMKDYGRAKLVGTQTFGKGSVQDLVNLGNGGSIKVTVAKWFTPLDNGIDGKGITPDYIVDLPDGTTPSTSDAQMAKALDVLQEATK
jgi:carboxyl-terminal processing protease